MTVKSGDKIPDVEVRTMGPEGPQTVRTGDVLGKGRVVLFAVPGAFTPGCSKIHLPGYVANADEVLAKGVDRIACIAVNDPWVMQAWGESQGAGDQDLDARRRQRRLHQGDGSRVRRSRSGSACARSAMRRSSKTASSARSKSSRSPVST